MRALRDMLAGTLWETEKEAIRKAFDKRCVYCNVEVRPEKEAKGQGVEPERFDHDVPVAKRGLSVFGNIVLACKVCDDNLQENAWEPWARKLKSIESGGKTRPLDVDGIRERMKQGRDTLERGGHDVSFSPDWFDGLPQELKDEITGLERQIHALDERAEDAAGRVHAHLGIHQDRRRRSKPAR